MERLLHLWRSPPRPKHIDKIYFRFDVFVSISQVFAFLMVILAGYYHEIADDGLKGSFGQLHYHGLYMRYALIFFQGEGLLAYRIFRHETKIMSKMVHTLMHICTLVLVVAALVNIVQFKNNYHISHMCSSHSWIGICLISVYLVQFAFGVINFSLPFSAGTRSSFVSNHKLVGLTVFVVSVAQSLTGSAQIPLTIHSQSNNRTTEANEYERLTNSSLLLNFTSIFTLLYSLSVIYMVCTNRWRRRKTRDEKI